MNQQRIGWFIPCYNEALTIQKVIADIKHHCPGKPIFVFDNNSTDQTASLAQRAGAHVISVPIKGKGNVVRRIFEAVDADAYIIIDGDDTYEVGDWKKLSDPVLNGQADMTVANRIERTQNSFRRFHHWGNRALTGLLNLSFRSQLSDILSGYRVIGSNMARGIAIDAKGFEIEAELTIQALENNFTILEIPANLRSRPKGSFSKLSTYKDGAIIAYTILKLLKDYKPLTFFGSFSIFAFGLFMAMHHWLPEIKYHSQLEYFLITTSVVSLFSGFILNSISQRTKEMFQILRKNNNTKLPVQHHEEKTKAA